MKFLFPLAFLAFFHTTCAQSPLFDILTEKEKTRRSCIKMEEDANMRALKGASYDPLVIENGVIVGFERIKTLTSNIVDSIKILTCPESCTFGDIGTNGTVLLFTKKKMRYSKKIRLRNIVSVKGRRPSDTLLYYLNGYLVSNSSLYILKSSIKEIVVYDNLKVAIWTTVHHGQGTKMRASYQSLSTM